MSCPNCGWDGSETATLPSLDGAMAFDDFWTQYPKKDGKEAARKAWRKLNPNNSLTIKILSAVLAQKSRPAWQADGGKYIPLPATWLNQRRWDDEGVTLYELTMPPAASKWTLTS